MKKRIIVADDMPSMTGSLKLMLSPYFEIIEAHSGIEVLDGCDEEPVDGVILDVNFDNGGMSGFDAAQLLRRQFPQLKIILFSAADYSSAERARVLEIGATFLPKPIDLSQVRRVFE